MSAHGPTAPATRQYESVGWVEYMEQESKVWILHAEANDPSCFIQLWGLIAKDWGHLDIMICADPAQPKQVELFMKRGFTIETICFKRPSTSSGTSP